jgi:hypothetical protein
MAGTRSQEHAMEMKTEGRDNRLSRRVRLQCPLRFRVVPVSEAGFRTAFARDISQTGFRFHTTEFLPKRTSLMVEMNLLGHAPVRSLAKALWVRERPSDDGYDVGGIFVEPPHHARRTLRELVSGR